VKKSVQLQLSARAAANLQQLSRQLGISCDEFATLCFEYVDINHQGIVNAAQALRTKSAPLAPENKNLSQHLQKLSAQQIALLLAKAAQKQKN